MVGGSRWEKLSFDAIYVLFQATNEVVGRVPKATASEMEAAVASCKKAFWNWSETSVLSRQQIFLRYQQLIKDNLVRHRGCVWWLWLNALQLILGTKLRDSGFTEFLMKCCHDQGTNWDTVESKTPPIQW